MRLIGVSFVLVSGLCVLHAMAADVPATIRVEGAAQGFLMPKTLHGIFFEEINRAGDGGLYAEMLANRSFEEHVEKMVEWHAWGTPAKLDKSLPLHANNQTSVKLAGKGGVVNKGFKGAGIPLKEGATYKVSFWARSEAQAEVVLKLESNDGKRLAETRVMCNGTGWKSYDAEMSPSASATNGQLAVWSAETLWLDQLSLMPKETWRGLPFRKDLAEMLAALKPGHIRFPGGCYIEGETMAFAHRWKDTVGPLEQRPTQPERWGYHSTGGFGVHEFLLWCEALNAEPVYVLNCGMSHNENVPLEKMGPFVQDALDFMEYATGPLTSRYGALRAAAGHPEPFKVNYLEIGNENGGDAYEERYALFHDALKRSYPSLILIANEWDYRVPGNRKLDVIDQHFYRPSRFFRQGSTMFDSADRSGPRIYLGEYASCHDAKAGTLRGALGDIAFLTGLERNSDLVTLAAYAPLLCHDDWSKWSPNMIHFNAHAAYGKPTYYAHQMMAACRGEVVIPCRVEGPVETLPVAAGGMSLLTSYEGGTFADVRVSMPGGKVLAEGNAIPWRIKDGLFNNDNGTLVRTGKNLRALASASIGDKAWGSDYDIALRVKAPERFPDRSLNWRSGLRIDVLGNRFTIGLGNWGNNVHTIEGMNTSEVRKGSLSAGKWHDVKITVRGQSVRVLLDGKVATEGTQTSIPVLCSSVTRSADSKTLFIKMVNSGPEALKMNLDLGKVIPAGTASGWVLTHSDPEATNTSEDPARVRPKPLTLKDVQPKMSRELPPWSLTVVSMPLL